MVNDDGVRNAVRDDGSTTLAYLERMEAPG